jgi:hypothetical protein
MNAHPFASGWLAQLLYTKIPNGDRDVLGKRAEDSFLSEESWR